MSGASGAGAAMPDVPPAELDAEGIIAVLNRHEVRYVVIGGYAALLHGASTVTIDLDITPSSSPENLDRLATALRDMGAELRASGVEEPLRIPLDRRTFEQFPTFLNLRTEYGDLDISMHPSAPNGKTFDYEQLARSAVHISLPESVALASLDDIISSKRAAARPKDFAVLPILEELRDQLGRSSS